MDLAALSLDPEQIIRSGGVLLVAAIIFAESGLLIGFFLPGDSLLFLAGVMASSAAAARFDGFQLNIYVLIPVVFVAAVAGDQVGYVFGNRVGPRMFTREDSRFFHKDHLVRAEHFFEKYGSKTIVIARFVPIVRTFAPIVAGIGSMRYRTFVLYNVVGGFLWAVGITLLGYFLGDAIGDDIDKYLLPLIALIVAISLVPPAVEFVKHRREKKMQAQEGDTSAAGETSAEETAPKA
ncbi:MAG: VTT domain-containing protein [Acidimicrobiia bacterium]|nr:VTT domain-containing protein [Acidimicrobiia bacterium]